ncbi:PaaX family transcriptional regulator C-terminal domain-containing protein [Microbacterium excoecariae]|uniref:PaaX family transcriptional regulator n=1 Tax=Microbacterium excoecariae TaxID=2715210 RepID=UPI00140BD3FE|nr:PaaX family transcriptional regulator C-terminal domain-containing protein [Microbacterium excoecariae]NHI15983.1 regulator [Microbacterium excoecariae]
MTEEALGEVLDDMESRPGSATSLLRTIVAIFLREMGGWISVAHLLELLDALDISDARARTAIARVKKKGLLIAETRDGGAGYRLADQAVPMLARGDRRVYNPRNMGADDRWYLISFTIPEERRAQRHQLRKRLEWIGCGLVSPALWIAPAFLADEIEEILRRVGVRDDCTTFVAERPIVTGDPRETVAAWWDLDAIRAHHDTFLRLHARDVPPPAGVTDREAFAIYIRAIDTWRIVPYIDPGLHPSLLPDDWPGSDTSRLLEDLRETYSAPATEYVGSVTGRRIDNPGRAARVRAAARIA